ncbi:MULTISPECIES: response regulator [Rhizobium]|uniref:DNA-binding response OmpR family regulator n=1 Tax=Rhizobium paranaense TaxID=1650438 RepID=A0A7W9D2B5_9HYPH|nr:response regulator [Rhizobium paranaense]MBB5574940.1 DNA-binding response OmpR family regulator [Rhizobium paranaense]
MNVLIVEDEGLVALQLKKIAADAGFSVLGPASGVEQALAYARRAEIALVDVGLSEGKSGPQLARRLIDRFHTTVIFVTGIPEAIRQGFGGAFAIIPKPFSDKQVAEALRRARDMRMGRENQITSSGV